MRRRTVLKTLGEQIKSCTACPLHKKAHQPVIESGPANAQIMLIGEAPGKEEDLEGVPFVGRSGKLLDWALEKVGMDRNKVYVANVLKHRPPNNKIPDDKKDEWIGACKPWLMTQICAIRPRVIVTLGKLATDTILGFRTYDSLDQNYAEKVRFSSKTGQQYHQYDGTIVIPTLHPSYCLRTGNKQIFRKHLKLAVKVVEE